MRSFNPMNKNEYHEFCKANLENLIRMVEYHMDELDSGWRNLSRAQTAVKKHQLQFWEDFSNSVETAAIGTLERKFNK